MDTFKLIGEINKDISRLDEKINSTDKSATVAFSYLLTKTDKVKSELDNNSYQVVKILEDSNFMKSQMVTLQNNIIDISKTSNEVLKVNTGMNNDVICLNEKIKEFETKFFDMNRRLERVENILNTVLILESGYIIVKKEESFIEKIYKKISNFFYKLFNTKKIIEAKKEEERKEIEKIESEKQRKIKEKIKKEQETKNTIKNLLN